VDPERGRIGLRLADDPEISGKSPEELAAMGTGDKGGRGDRGNGRGGRGREGGGRGGRDRGGRGRDRDRERGPNRDPDRERAGSESSTSE
jgi:polyribonucleotide nucleotidyltransferase